MGNTSKQQINSTTTTIQENQVSEIMLQDFDDFQKFALNIQQQEDGFNKKDLMEEANTDMFFPSAKPSDITGQTLAVTMETDKTKVLNSMALPSTINSNEVENAKVQKLQSNWMESTSVDFAPCTTMQ